MLTGGPVLLAVAGGAPAEVTALFAGLALFRAPYTLALGLVAPLTDRLTALVVRAGATRCAGSARARAGDAGRAGRGRAGSAAWLGPPLMELVFGDGIRLAGDLPGLLAVGTVFAIANLVLTILVVARGRPRGLVRGWLVGLVPGVVLLRAVRCRPARPHLLDVRRRRGRGLRLAGRRGRAGRAAPVSRASRAARKTDEPNGRSRRRSTRLSARESPMSSRSTTGETCGSPASAAGVRRRTRRTSRSAAKNGKTPANPYVQRRTSNPAPSTAARSRGRV